MKKTYLYGILMLSIAFPMKAQLETATFENLDLPDNSFWCGEFYDEDDEDMGFSQGWFESGSFRFNNFYWPDYSTWAFFAYSSRTENTFSAKSMTDDQFNSITGGGAGGSRIFGVAFPASYMGHTVMTVNDGETAAVIPGMEIVNTAWVVDCILNGDGYEGPFKRGDWMKLILTGFNNDEETVTKEYYLADYRSENVDEHYYLNEWTWIDLSGLGEVSSIRFSIDSSKANAYGVTTPTYVCIDNVGASEDTSKVEMTGADTLQLNWIAGSRHAAVSGAKTYNVVDLAGKVVAGGAIYEKNVSIDLSSLASGIYIITVTDGVSRKSLKIGI